MSFEEFLTWEHEGGLAEWVNGEVIDNMGVTLAHQRIVEFFDRLLGWLVESLGLGEVHTAPYVMRAKPDGSGREPDVMFIATANLARLENRCLVGPADLIIEVASDESLARDRAEKFYEYQSAGVREYWIIDPRPGLQRADFYVLDNRGRFQPVPIGADGIYRSSVLPAIWLNVNWLWADRPSFRAALAEIVGKDKLAADLTDMA
jgi:Uma2 family endonuclease